MGLILEEFIIMGVLLYVHRQHFLYKEKLTSIIY